MKLVAFLASLNAKIIKEIKENHAATSLIGLRQTGFNNYIGASRINAFKPALNT
jgi:hypothetical protein